jgi:ferredoxin-thioredoxin reductase catalytic subunit
MQIFPCPPAIPNRVATGKQFSRRQILACQCQAHGPGPLEVAGSCYCMRVIFQSLVDHVLSNGGISGFADLRSDRHIA